MEIKKVGIPVVKPVGGTSPTPVTPVAVKPVGVTQVKPVTIPSIGAKEAPVVVIPEPTLNPTNPVKTLVEEEVPKGGLFSEPSVVDTPKEERLEDIKNAVNKTEKKKPSKKTTKADEDGDESDKKESKSKFTVPLKVRIYDREVFVIDDPNTTEDQIRLKAVDEFGFFEFSKDRTKFIYNEAKDQVVLKASFEKRG